MKKYNLLLMVLLMFSVLMIFNLNSLYMMWVFMELNVLIFLTLMILNLEYFSNIMIKYYLMSSISSIIFIYFITLNMMKMNFYMIFIMNMMMFLKLGLIPFHFWFIDMMMNLNWLLIFFLATVQKIIPFVILSFIFQQEIFFFFILLNGIFSVLLNFNQILMKKIMAYSSINHMLWMMMSLLMNLKLWIFYFLNYMFINMILFYMFDKLNISQILDLYKFMILKINMYKYFLMLMFFSLGGIPPFYGFMLKFYLIENMMSWLMMFLLIYMIFCSLIFLYFYLRLIFNSMIINTFTLNLNFYILKYNMNMNLYILMILIFSVMLLFFFFWFFY